MYDFSEFCGRQETHMHMTEKERMQKCLWYDANNDEELIAERKRGQALCRKYNILPSDDVDDGKKLLAGLLGSVGDNVEIVAPFFCDYGFNITMGDHVFLNTHCVILDEASVSFGNHVFVGPNCSFYTAIHPIQIALRNRGLEKALPIRIESNVWLGGNVTVLPGVTIGQGSVVGAGSVVTHDVPPYTVSAGNPCAVLRELTPDERNG